MKLTWEVWEPNPTCGACSPGGRMRCEYPPDHRLGEAGVADHHCARDRIGRWRTWPRHWLDENYIRVSAEISGTSIQASNPAD